MIRLPYVALVVVAGCSCSKSHPSDAGMDASFEVSMDTALDTGLDTFLDSDILIDAGDSSQLDANLGCVPELESVEWGYGPELDRTQDGRQVVVVGNEVVVAGDGLSGVAALQYYSPSSRSWSRIQLNRAANPTATLLASGRLLIAGSQGRMARDLPRGRSSDWVRIYDSETHSHEMITSMAVSRGFHSAVRLEDDRVMVAGGWHTTGIRPDTMGPTASVELFDESDETWVSTPNMVNARWAFSLTLLSTGRILAVGGFGEGGLGADAPRLRSAEVYDPSINAWHAVADMSTGRAWHEAQLLPSGRVLVVGGENEASEPLASAEFFDPVTETWSSAPSLPAPAEDMASLRLPSGRILVVGGFARSDESSMSSSAQANLYDESRDCWQALGSLNTPRWHFGLAQLPDGRVMAVPGWTNLGPTSTSEITSVALD